MITVECEKRPWQQNVLQRAVPYVTFSKRSNTNRYCKPPETTVRKLKYNLLWIHCEFYQIPLAEPV